MVLLSKEVLFASFGWHLFIYLFIFTLGHPNKNTFVKKWSACIKIYKKNSVIYLWQYYTVLKALMPMGLRKCLKQIIWIKHNGVKNPNWPEANHWPFSRVVKDLTNLGRKLPGTNPASGHGGTWTQGLWIASPAFLPFGHSASMQTLNKLGIHLSGMSCYKKECLMKRMSELCQIFMSSKLYKCYSY